MCPYCEKDIKHIINNIPNPNLEGDSFSTTCVDDYDIIECGNCSHIFNYTIQSSISGGFLHIEDIQNNDYYSLDIEEIEYDEYENAVLNNTKYYKTFTNQLDNITKLNSIDLPNQELQNLQNNLLFSNIITTLETYLSDALITTINNNGTYFVKFVETYKDFVNKKVSFNQLFEATAQIKKLVKKELLDLLYHNIPKVSGIYKDALNVIFPENEEILKLIAIRHDIIHRNGKNKDNNVIVIDRIKISETVEIVRLFIEEIDKQMREIQLTTAST